MKMPLPHSAASGSSIYSGKSELPEGATWEADSCHHAGMMLPSLFIYVFMFCYVITMVDLVLV